jgi:hypothetical protein
MEGVIELLSFFLLLFFYIIIILQDGERSVLFAKEKKNVCLRYGSICLENTLAVPGTGSARFFCNRAQK